MNTVGAALVAKMFLAGTANLDAKKEWINELNVFPVPDGDTGTNMTMTIMAAAKEVSAITDMNFETLSKAISMGSLRGARGNSGVILSQLFRGFTKVMKEAEGELTCTDLAVACRKAVKTAYKAVMKPKEGTILTVAKGIADEAQRLAEEGEEDILVFVEKVVAHGNAVLAQTPEMLPVLKQAGVVDSGGQGLMVVLEGALDALLGKEINYDVITPSTPAEERAASANIEEADITFGYCTEFIVVLEKEFSDKDEAAFKEFLESIGDSIVCVNMDDIVKVHVHTNDPGLAIQRGLSYGQLTSMKIDNMREEHQERLNLQAEQASAPTKAEAPRKPYGFVSVSVGEGLSEIFKSLGVDYMIEGGQTMNPSTEDMLNAIDHVNADTIYILPNNKNIILAANQAQALVEDKEIIVIPTKTIPQGITALISFAPDASSADNAAAMTEALEMVKTGQVTYAVRDTELDGKVIKKDDIMGIGDSAIEAVGQEIETTTMELINAMVDADSELISVYYGEDIDEDTASALVEKLEEAYPDCDIELQYGGQPIYYYIVSVE